MDQLFENVAWFLDPRRQDYEWPVVFVINADSPGDSKSYGDAESLTYARQVGRVFLSSVAEELARPLDNSFADGRFELVSAERR